MNLRTSYTFLSYLPPSLYQTDVLTPYNEPILSCPPIVGVEPALGSVVSTTGGHTIEENLLLPKSY